MITVLERLDFDRYSVVTACGVRPSGYFSCLPHFSSRHHHGPQPASQSELGIHNREIILCFSIAAVISGVRHRHQFLNNIRTHWLLSVFRKKTFV